MKRCELLLVLALTAFLSACATSNSSTATGPTPLPAGAPIEVISADHYSGSYVILGQVSGANIDALKAAARQLGANAIAKPGQVDPSSGLATTNALRLTK